MDYSQLDASSSNGPGIQYDESGEGSERRTPSPDGGSPSEGESLQLGPPSEGGGGASPPEPPTEPPIEPPTVSPPEPPSPSTLSERDSGVRPPEPPSRYPKRGGSPGFSETSENSQSRKRRQQLPPGTKRIYSVGEMERIDIDHEIGVCELSPEVKKARRPEIFSTLPTSSG